MASSSSLGRINEDDVFSPSSSDGEFSDFDQNTDRAELKRVVTSFVRNSSLAPRAESIPKVASAIQILKKDGLISDVDYQNALICLLKEYFRKRKFHELIEEIENVNIRNLQPLITFFLKQRRADADFVPQIVQAIADLLSRPNSRLTDVLVADTCYFFVRLLENWLKDGGEVLQQGATSVLMLLYRAACESSPTQLLAQDQDGKLDDTVEFVRKVLDDDSVPPDVYTKLLFIRAVVLILRPRRCCEKTQEGLVLVAAALTKTHDSDLRRMLEDLHRDGEDFLKVRADAPQEEPKKKKKKRKKKVERARSAEPEVQRRPEVVAGPPVGMATDSSYTDGHESEKSDAEQSIGGRESLDAPVDVRDPSTKELLGRLDFAEKFRMSFCNREQIARRIQEKNWKIVTPEGTRITEALWSVMKEEDKRKDWNLANLEYDDFYERLLNLTKEEGSETLVNDHRILPLVAERFLVCIEVLTSVYPLIMDVPITPAKMPHRSTIRLLHLRRRKYSGLLPGVDAIEFPPILPPVADPEPRSQLSDSMGKMLRRLAWLKKHQKAETFTGEPVSGEGKKKRVNYENLPKKELERRWKEEPAKYKKCMLSLQGPHEGVAKPCPDSGAKSKPEELAEIPLRGRRNCGLAFEGDTVLVRVFTDKGTIMGGRVVGVLESSLRPVNQVFFCKVCSDQTTLMKPLCATFPKIHVANEPGEEEYAKTLLPNAESIFDFSHQLGSHTHEQDERRSKKFANKCLVTVYSVSAQGQQLKFSVKEVKRIHRLTCELIFVVVYQKWSPYYLYPYGHVVDYIEPSCGLEDEMALMRLQCQLPHSFEEPHAKDKLTTMDEAKQIGKRVDKPQDIRGRKDFRGVTTFSIDNDDTEDIDDAISVEEFEDFWEIGIHITDVSHYLKHDGYLDRAARERLRTVYGIPSTTKPIHMLPSNVATERLSLLENAVRLCLSVIFRLKTDGTHHEEAEVVKTVIRSNYRLTKTEVSTALRQTGPATLNDELLRCLNTAYRLARVMRGHRLGLAQFFHKPEMQELDEVGSTLEADVLVEEFMVAANTRVAQFLLHHYPAATLLRTNDRPDESDVDAWMLTHRPALSHSGKLRRDLAMLVGMNSDVTVEQPLLLYSDVKEKIESARRDDDVGTVFRLLAAEQLHPMLQLGLREWYAVCKQAHYQASGSEDLVTFGENKTHFGLDAEAYTRFTSPLRSYPDIVSHRFIHAALASRPAPLSPQDVSSLAEECNEMERRHRQYDRRLALFRLFRRARSRPLSLSCVIADVSSPHILLDHCLIASLPPNARRFTHAQLNLSHNPRFQSPSRLECQWRQRLFIVDESRRRRHPNLRDSFYVRRRNDRFDVRSLESLWYFQWTTRTTRPPTCLRLCSILSQPPNQQAQLLSRLSLQKAASQVEKFKDVTSEVRALDQPPGQHCKIVLNPAVDFSLQLDVQAPLRAQFSAPSVRRARMRSPKLQYLQLTASFGVCLEHRDDPVGCFGASVGDLIAEERVFLSVEEYQNTWLPVLRMETVTESLMDENAFHLNAVPIHWMTDGTRLAGLICLDDAFCRDPYRQIRFSEEGTLTDCLDHGHACLDFLCIRVPLQDFVWIGHAVVKRVSTTTVGKTQFVLYFEVQQMSCPLPPQAVEEGVFASVEVIVKTMPKQRQERAVELLSSVQDTTAAKIALGQFVVGEGLSYQLDFVFNFIQMKKFRSDHLNTATCNHYQRSAIENSFKWPISLIWGPPGTGKTITGVQITFWFSEFNKKLNPDFSESKPDDSDEAEERDSPRDNFPDIWKDYQVVPSRRRPRHRNSSSTSNEETHENDLLNWIDFPKVSDKCLDSVNDVPLEKRRRQVLYCGPSNNCVNCVAEHLRTKIDAGRVSLVRVFSEQVELKEFPVPGEDASFSRINSQVEVPENLLEISLHRLIRLPGKPHAALLDRFDKAFNRVVQYLDGKAPALASTRPKVILQRLREASSDYHKLLTLAKGKEIREHDVVLCTSAVSASLLLQKHCRFCQVLIDEAGMCTEAETLVPLVPVDGPQSASAAIENVVLIGDHKQLRPILRNQVAAELGLQRSMLQRHWTAGRRQTQGNKAALIENRTMLQMQYRMHPSICEFPSSNNYGGHLKTGVNYVWAGLGDEDIDWRKVDRFDPQNPDRPIRKWTGLNAHEVARGYYKSALQNANAAVLKGCWPGLRRPTQRFECMRNAELPPWGEEERVVFLHVEGREDSLTLSTEEGNENSKCNIAEVNEVRRIYIELRRRFSQPRQALLSVAVLSQYLHQVNEIERQLKEALERENDNNRMMRMFKARREGNAFWKPPSPIVSTVVRSQGSEFDYVIMSTVRSLPAHDIDPYPTPGWEKKYLGFITDINQVNVALTRARKGLIIIGNGKLLQVHSFWDKLLTDLKSRGCYVENAKDFPAKTGHVLDIPTPRRRYQR